MKRGQINQCVITLTRECNLRCKFCYAKEAGYARKDYISCNELKEIIDFCNKLEINDIVLSGGEPSLYGELFEFLKYIKTRERRMSVSISSNGIKLSDFKYCKELVENGVSYIDISLKGANEKECIECVGINCLEQQLEAIENLSKLPVTLTCSMVLTNENCSNFCDVIEKAYESGARQFSFSFALDNTDSEEKDLNYLKRNNPLSIIDVFISKVDRLDEITKGEWWIEYTFPLCAYSDEQLDILEGRLAAPCQIFNGMGITFDTKKKLIPCSMHLDNFLGQFGTDFSTAEEFEILSESAKYKETIDVLKRLPSDKCLSCKLIEECNGGCPIFWKNTSFESFQEFIKENR